MACILKTMWMNDAKLNCIQITFLACTLILKEREIPRQVNRHLFGWVGLRRLYAQCQKFTTCSTFTVWLNAGMRTQQDVIDETSNPFFHHWGIVNRHDGQSTTDRRPKINHLITVAKITSNVIRMSIAIEHCTGQFNLKLCWQEIMRLRNMYMFKWDEFVIILIVSEDGAKTVLYTY